MKIVSETLVTDIVDCVPAAGPVLLQHGRTSRARRGELHADYPPLTVAEYASLNGVALEPFLRLLNRAAETDEFSQAAANLPVKGRRPDLLGRGKTLGYTGAFVEAGSVDIQDFVTAHTMKGGPE